MKKDDARLIAFLEWVLKQRKPVAYAAVIREAAVNKAYLRQCMDFTVIKKLK